jgi:hypothetical protein
VSRRVNDSYEVIMERLRTKVYRELDNHDSSQGDITDFYVIHTFDDAVIVRDEVSGKLYEVPYMRGDTEVYLGLPREVENVYVLKRLEEVGIDIASKGLNVCELTGPIVMKNASKHIAYAAVLVPGEPDSDGEVVTKEKIEQAAHEWMQSYRNVDLQHTLNNVAVPVESYVLPMDMEVDMQGVKTILPAGTWVLASKVLDEATWDMVEKGELTGYSVMGIRRTTLETASKSAEVALKKTLLRDLGEDWIAAAVSIVDEPTVPKAKFFALKSKEVPAEKSKSWYQKVREVLFPNNSAVKEDVPDDEKEDDLTMKPEDLKNMIDEAVKSAVEPLQAEIEALKSKADEVETEEVDETTSQEEEAFKSKVLEKLDELEARIGKKNAAPKSLKGQDGDEGNEAKKSQLEDRDLFGRKRAYKEVR